MIRRCDFGFDIVAASAGAAAFFAMREYEKHQSANGQPPSHQFAKELMAGVAGAEVSCFTSSSFC